MARGRRPDSPAQQVAKGQPGKRKRAAAIEAEVERLAANDPLNPPPFIRGSRAKRGQGEALRIWRELAPQLQRRNLLDRMDRYAFGRWCVYQAEWIKATEEIATAGISRVVKTVSGDEMLRRHPAAAHRDRIELAIAKLEAAYGLTPADRYKVMRDQALAPLGGLFDRELPEDTRSTAGAASKVADPVGFLTDRAMPSGTRLS